MVMLTVSAHPRGLSVAQQRQVYALRKHGLRGKKLGWKRISEQVVNLQGEAPYWKVCRDAYNSMHARSNHAAYDYSNCGRKPKLTSKLAKWLVSRLRALRKVKECTSTVLQLELAKHKRVKVEASLVRKALKDAGYKWSLRAKKPKYNKKEKQERLAFAKQVMRLSIAELRAKMSLSLDGVTITMPPTEKIARDNYCRSDVRYCYKLPSEGNLEELQGYDNYKKQVPKLGYEFRIYKKT